MHRAFHEHRHQGGVRIVGLEIDELLERPRPGVGLQRYLHLVADLFRPAVDFLERGREGRFFGRGYLADLPRQLAGILDVYGGAGRLAADDGVEGHVAGVEGDVGPTSRHDVQVGRRDEVGTDRHPDINFLEAGEVAGVHLHVDRRLLARRQDELAPRRRHAAAVGDTAGDLHAHGIDIGDRETMKELGAVWHRSEIVNEDTVLEHLLRPGLLLCGGRGRKRHGHDQRQKSVSHDLPAPPSSRRIDLRDLNVWGEAGEGGFTGSRNGKRGDHSCRQTWQAWRRGR